MGKKTDQIPQGKVAERMREDPKFAHKVEAEQNRIREHNERMEKRREERYQKHMGSAVPPKNTGSGRGSFKN